MKTDDGNQKILIIDDTPANIQILNAILKDQYQIFFATHGKIGLEIARREQPDLILLDIMMPGMSGYDVCSQLKNSEKTHNIPIIFITAMVNPEEEARGLEAGAIDYLTKPVSPPIVRMRIRNHLELKRQRDMLEHLSQERAEKNSILESLARERWSDRSGQSAAVRRGAGCRNSPFRSYRPAPFPYSLRY